MDGTLKDPEVIKPPQLVAAEFSRVADKTYKITKESKDLPYMIQCEDVNILENANWKALFQAFNVLSAERVFLLTITDAILDWRRQEKQTKDDTDLEQALARDYIFFQSVSELCLEKFNAEDVQVAALFAICWEHYELKVPDANDAKLATYVLAENKKHVTELCNNVLARIYPFRFLARPDELDKLFHLQIVKNKKKLDKKKEDALMYFLIPLIHNDSGLSDKKGWSEFRESLETTFAPVVGSWKDKKGEKR
ncbi:uncharacterized protein ACA1_281190 [Acanthamoeba castellanii str. Neff]|uniref:Uncharacterized protein n=1 Tax=Acanthamoeba castellanii (strain ATCC 30010 / Neff) TaxID=1257118 RepID=L8H7A5_ACACF|nr:uncharacterized protein ACA1_281190 [Acanthamoeba castellanii str. Neff]ELR21025.1 hypothetical protein ACA1_281190 [Acanthamoeba castellanii str. Neff]